MTLFDTSTMPVQKRPNYQQQYREQQLKKLGAPEDWTQSEIPTLNGESRIVLNAETQGVQWWGGDKPIGWAYWFPESGRHGYLGMRHEGGGNHPVERVHEFLRDVRGVQVCNANTKFDIHMAREDGVDLVEQGNCFRDVMHDAALLDDHRRQSLRRLIK